jgi:hypothetical protein
MVGTAHPTGTSDSARFYGGDRVRTTPDVIHIYGRGNCDTVCFCDSICHVGSQV